MINKSPTFSLNYKIISHLSLFRNNLSPFLNLLRCCVFFFIEFSSKKIRKTPIFRIDFQLQLTMNYCFFSLPKQPFCNLLVVFGKYEFLVLRKISFYQQFEGLQCSNLEVTVFVIKISLYYINFLFMEWKDIPFLTFNISRF